jgi:hypothetical protein
LDGSPDGEGQKAVEAAQEEGETAMDDGSFRLDDHGIVVGLVGEVVDDAVRGEGSGPRQGWPIPSSQRPPVAPEGAGWRPKVGSGGGSGPERLHARLFWPALGRCLRHRLEIPDGSVPSDPLPRSAFKSIDGVWSMGIRVLSRVRAAPAPSFKRHETIEFLSQPGIPSSARRGSWPDGGHGPWLPGGRPGVCETSS